MSASFLVSLATLLGPIVALMAFIGLLLLLLWLLRWGSHFAKGRTIIGILSYVGTIIEQCVAAAEEEVRVYKFGDKAWDAVAAQAITSKVVGKILTICGREVVIVLKLMHSDATPAQFVEELVKSAVERKRVRERLPGAVPLAALPPST